MPDILIRGMEMPASGIYPIYISADGAVYDGDSYVAEAVELPPHGDLIQRTDVLAVVDEAYEYGDVIKRKDFDEPNIPTIVPAEKGVE